MSLRVKLTIFMLIVSLFPMLLYASISYGQIRESALNTAIETSDALFQSKMSSYEQKVERLYNTALDVVSGTQLRLLFKAIKNSDALGDYSNFQRWQIVRNSAVIERSVDAHYAAQRDLLNGIGLIACDTEFAVIKMGNLAFSNDAVDNSRRNVGIPLLRLDREGGRTFLSVCVSFSSSLDPADILGTCVLNVNQRSLFQTLLPSELAPNEQLFILDGSKRVLFHSDSSQIGGAFDNNSLLGGPGEAGRHSYLAERDGETFIVTCQQSVSNPDWTVYYAMPYAYFVESGQDIANMIVPFAVLCALMAIAAALICSWNVYNPIRHLTRAISRMSGRNIKILEPRRQPYEIELLTGSLNRLMEDVNELLRKVEDEAENTKKAEIIALRAQVSPHFLYNTLNVIKCMAAQNQTAEIQIAVTSLIDLLRSSIGDTRDVVPLEKELQYVNSYILLQRYRLDLHFQYRVHIEPELWQYAVPHFMLQPIVENALIHAFSEITRDDNAIDVSAQLEGGMLHLSVEDNGDGVDPALTESLNEQFEGRSGVWLHKVGLNNVVERSRRLFGGDVQLRIENTERGAKVTFSLPAILYRPEREDYKAQAPDISGA